MAPSLIIVSFTYLAARSQAGSDAGCCCAWCAPCSVSTWSACGQHVVSTGLLHVVGTVQWQRQHVVSTGLLHVVRTVQCQHVVSMWSACGQHRAVASWRPRGMTTVGDVRRDTLCLSLTVSDRLCRCRCVCVCVCARRGGVVRATAHPQPLDSTPMEVLSRDPENAPVDGLLPATPPRTTWTTGNRWQAVRGFGQPLAKGVRPQREQRPFRYRV